MLTPLLSLLLILPPVENTDWKAAAERLGKSLVLVESEDGVCTGIVAGEKGEKDYILTAGHCQGEKMMVDGLPAELKALDRKKDLMVLEVDDTLKPLLPLATDDPTVGEEVASYGYGYGLERPIFRVGHISDDDTHIQEFSGGLIVLDAAFVGGQSGGPVVNQTGELVMLVQMTTDRAGFGVGAETIKDKMGRWFGKK